MTWSKRRTWDKHSDSAGKKSSKCGKVANDITFLDNYLTKEFCEKHKLFAYKYNETTGQYEISDREFNAIKQKLLMQLTNFGQPIIHVSDGNHKNRGELYLRHQHEGVDLDLRYARDTLENVFHIWKRTVHLETRVGDRGKLFTFDGKDHIELNITST